MNSVVDIALAERLTLPIGFITTFEAQADQSETISGRDGNLSIGTQHDFLARESVVVREVVDIHENEALGLPVAR